MSKYIIEIEDEPFVKLSALFGKEGLYRAKGFKSLVFDQFGLDKLTPLDKALSSELGEAYQKGFEAGQHEATTLEYQQGLDDAWECAKKIFGYVTDGGLTLDELRNVFGAKGVPFCTPDILRTNTASEALAKLKAHEEQQKAESEIEVGDEITTAFGNAVVVRKYMGKDGVERCKYWHYENVQIYHDLTFSLRKTGRHFPQVEELIKAMKDSEVTE